MILSLNRSLLLILIICAVIGIIALHVVSIRNGRLRSENTEQQTDKKPLNKLLFIPLLFLVTGIVVILYLYNTTKWKNLPMTDQDKIQIASTEMLLPELSDSLDRQYQKSFRDTSYLYDTIWFDDTDKLFAELNYADDRQREAAKQKLLKNKVDTHEFNTLEGGKMDVYYISENDLPIQNNLSENNDRQYHYSYKYYVLIDRYYNDRAKLICVKKGM